ncbi:bacillithiol system redox-active protein YtxJ [Flavobacterium coralii]|uniref:bacillithiol system redox-active protein YtxJ n=1 Tax=Flavobacterium coralii TaxID=2838017 RepID=UPI000C3D9407|nr:bacillithiol system redox-active protein YtxJ [Flavobacterium sp.]|tara:strand:- start:24034 stop:24426 length:393 start_codon:yes stop_codon:yes gene_type:complete
MGFLDNIFGNNDSKVTSSETLKWNELTEIQQLESIAAESYDVPVLVFKHSTRCSISRMALRNFEREYAIEEGKLKPYFLDLLEHRDISNEIAAKFGVTHQSPQVVLIKDGKAVYDASHSDIEAEDIKSRL